SILAEPPVALVDKYVDQHGTRKVAEAYLKFLYTDTGQEIAAKNFYRPRSEAVLAKYRNQFPDIKLFTITDVAGPWKETRLKPRVPILKRPHSVVPGFGLTLGYTVSYLSLIVLIPLSAVVVKGVDQPWASFKDAVFDTRTLLAWRLTFGTAFTASVINAFFGLIVAWVL